MNAHDILNQLQADSAAGKDIDFRSVREQIHEAFVQTDDSNEHAMLLAIFTATADLVERNITNHDDKEKFKATRQADYNLLVVRESLVGENISAELLNAVTLREVQAGRMSEDHELRKAAITGLHSTVQVNKDNKDTNILFGSRNKTGRRKWFGK